MWLSEKMAKQQTPAPDSGDGVVSMGGQLPAVVTDGECRNMVVISPGGYAWQPCVNEEVLVLQDRIIGVRQEKKLAPGEICIFSGDASIRLGTDGSIRLDGDVFINGERWVPGDNDPA